MKFGLALPLGRISPPGEFQSAEAVREIASAVERAGVAAACLSEHPAPDADWLHNDPAAHDALDPPTALAFVAAATTRLKVFTNVLVLPFRNPFMTAKAAATLQVLSNHRLILGDDGRKLSKSTGATGLRELRAADATVADIRRRVGL